MMLCYKICKIWQQLVMCKVMMAGFARCWKRYAQDARSYTLAFLRNSHGLGGFAVRFVVKGIVGVSR